MSGGVFSGKRGSPLSSRTRLQSPNHSVGSLAADRLSDHFGTAAVAPVRKLLHDRSRRPAGRSQALWILHRLGELTEEELVRAISGDAPDLLRIHGYRVLAERNTPPRSFVDWLVLGFDAGDGRIRRAAVMAAAAHPSDGLVSPLLELAGRVSAEDVHLLHAVKMALRNHLRKPERLEGLADTVLPGDLPDKQQRFIAGICLAIETSAAGEFLVRYLTGSEEPDRNRLARLMKHAVEHAEPESVGRLAEVAQRRFSNDLPLQQELLAMIRSGLPAADSIPQPITHWADALVRQWLAREGNLSSNRPLAWSFHPHPGKPDQGNPWVIQQRSSADGVESLFFSSLPRGESWTGLYRSEPFKAGEQFRFFAAGHIGFPNQPVHAENFIRLRDAQTHEVLREAVPPRNDIAQSVTWDTRPFFGERVYVELADGDTDRAYAWLAVGRFSVEALNPSRYPERVRNAARLIADFHLHPHRPAIAALLSDFVADPETARELGKTLASLSPSATASAWVELLGMSPLPLELRKQAAGRLTGSDETAPSEILTAAMQYASTSQQAAIAERLAENAEGFDLLLRLISNGKASAGLLTKPAIASRLTALKSEPLSDRVAELTSGLPDENEELQRLISRRRQTFLAKSGSAVTGAELFRKHCAVCHQVAGQGKKVGPNLDGIGNRGSERLIEDVLAPNRNVDVAFRASTILTVDGQVLTGLVRPDGDDGLVVIDGKGQESRIPVEAIEQQSRTVLSPMPAGFGESLSPEDFRHLVAYLLSLR